MKIVKILGMLLFTSSLCAEGKPPEFWCRAESEAKGEGFLEYDLTLDEACTTAMEACTQQHDDCYIESYGEWND